MSDKHSSDDANSQPMAGAGQSHPRGGPEPIAVQQLRATLGSVGGGIAAMVDDVLAVCQQHQLRLDWREGRCRVQPAAGPESVIDTPLPRWAFRAVLARVSALCGERGAAPASPYGGGGVLAVSGDPSRLLHATFANTASEQSLVLAPTEPDKPDGLDSTRSTGGPCRDSGRAR